MKKLRLASVLLILALLMGSGIRGAAAQSSDSAYVSETGHWIWGEFLRTYNSVNNPQIYFGYPITDDFTDPATGRQMQYFQKARFDLVETPEGSKIQIAPLGELLHPEAGQLAGIPNEGPTCRAFDSGYSVCYAFLQFYDAYDGKTWFGDPISAIEMEDGLYVQYFQNARMEWWPDRPTGEKVALSELGQMYFDRAATNSALLTPSRDAASTAVSVEPAVNVFALKSLVGAGEDQTIYVIVMDQYLKPLADAEVRLTLYTPDGGDQFFNLGKTSSLGICQLTFQVKDYPVQSVFNAAAEVNYQGATATGKTWFRIWW